MLMDSFSHVYDKFKLNFYKNIFKNFEGREASLTTTEAFSVEVIHALSKPTISQYASFLNISHPNANYKISSLVKKGYVKKIQSKEDRREFFLEVTDKFHNYNDMKNAYIHLVMERMKERFTKNELLQFKSMLDIISNELMPEVTPDVLERQKTLD